MPIFNLFKPATDRASTSDDQSLAQIESANTVRTTDTITKFIPVNAGQVTAFETKLRQREEQQKNFFKLLELKERWSKLDTETTVRLFQYLASEHGEITQRKLARYPLKMAMDKSRLAYAQADHKLIQNRAAIDAEISQLQTAQAEAGKKLKEGKKK